MCPTFTRTAPLLLVAVLVGLLLPACGPGGKPGGPDSTIRRVAFMVFGDPEELAAYQALTAAFRGAHPDIRVDLVHIPGPSEYRRRMGADFAAGTPADVLLINYRRYAGFAARGVLEPLGPYLARSRVLREAEFYPEVLAPFRWKGELLGIPQNLSSLVVYYNRTLFDAAAVPYPRSDWTWDDFLRAARALTRDTDGDGSIDQHGLGTEVSLSRLAPFVWQNGGELVDDSESPHALFLYEDPAVAAAEWFVNLQVRHRVVPNAAEEKAEDSESRFQNGRIAMFLNSRRGVPAYRNITAFEWDVAALPRGKRPAGILHADAYFMPAAARDKEAAWRFIEFASSPEGQRILAATGRTVPSLKSVAESPAFLNPESRPRNSRVFLEAIPHLRTVPIHPNWVDVEELAGDELERAFYGRVSIHEALIVAVQRAEEYFERP